MSSITSKIFGTSKYLGIFKDTLVNGNYYLGARKIIRRIERMSKEDILQYQFKIIKDLITYAYEHVPFYNEHFDQAGFKPVNFRKLEDIQSIPYLTKNLIRNNFSKMVSDEMHNKHLKLVKTGGTTGCAPLEFYLDRRSSSPVEFAYIQYIWKRADYHFRDKCIVLRGDQFNTDPNEKVIWKMNYPMNWLMLSHYHMNEDTLSGYLEKMREFAPKFIITYPSLIYIIARHIKSNRLQPLKSLQAIICSSETLHQWQREYITEAFKVKVFSYYGLTEKCCIASQCTDSNNYEFLPSYGYVEVINKSGKWCSHDGESGEIVATGLNNFLTPLIRYKTEDLCKLSVSASENHEGWLTAKEITGRISEFLVDKNNGLITFPSSDEIFWNIMHKLNAYQYIQDTPGKLTIRLDLKESLSSKEISDIYHTLSGYFEGFEFQLSETGNIPRTGSGKFRYLIQHIPIDFYANA